MWGYVLIAPGRPPLDEQRRVLATLGVKTGQQGTIWTDTIERGKRGRNAGQTQLEARNDLMQSVQSGDKIIIADPYCIGLSAADAAWFLGEMRTKNVTVTVNGSLYNIEPGDDVSALVEEVGKAQNRAQAALSRAKANKSE